jgi:hypothetical protein
MADPRDPSGAGPARRFSSPLAAGVGALSVVLVVIAVVRASRPSAPEESGPEQTSVMISSEPAGATVSREDGGALGVTPFQVTLPKANAELPVVVTLQGYQTRHTTVPLFSESGRVDVMLTPVGVEPPKPPKPPPDGWEP